MYLPPGLRQMRRRLNIMGDGAGGELALEVRNLQRLKPESLARDDLVFHPVFRADK